jgi:Pregnancy-associated plasma protein-A
MKLHIILLLLLFLGCSRQALKTERSDLVLTKETPGFAPRKPAKNANDWVNYLPDTLYPAATPILYVRMNIHYVNSSDRKHPFTGEKMRSHAQFMITVLNHMLENNTPMYLPAGNNTPAMDARIRVVLATDPNIPGDTGIYEHLDDSLCWVNTKKGTKRNFFDTAILGKYNLGGDSVVNVYIMSHDPDSVASASYKPLTQGVWLVKGIKLVTNLFNPNDEPGAHLILHELGHGLTLMHAWGNDGCDDTPKHKNCYGIDPENGCPLDSTSNNFMDYNTFQRAITPCQIAKMRKDLISHQAKHRAWLQRDWCQNDPAQDVFVSDDLDWGGERDLKGSVTIGKGATLRISGRVHLPAGASITVRPGGKLVLLDGAWLHNDCGLIWQGVLTQTRGKQTGLVEVLGNYRFENVE